MQVLVNVPNNKSSFFMELLKTLDFVDVIKQVEDKEKIDAINNLVNAFNDVTLYEQGKKQLKTAENLLDEL